MLHKLVKRQIRKCTKNDQIVVEKLYSLISTAYFEFEETIKRIERTDSIFEQEVKTLHNQLLEQKKGAEDLLNGSGQIIFSFNEKLELGPARSTKTGEVFNLKEDSPYLPDLLQLSEEQTHFFRHWTSIMFRASTLSRWEKYTSICPILELQVKKNGINRTIKFDYRPIVRNKVYSYIMMIGTDITKEKLVAKQLKKQKEIHEQNAQIINTFFANDPLSIGDFVEEISFLAKRLEQQAYSVLLKKTLGIDEITEFFRIVHTIKGNAETLGFKHLGSLCHELESEISNKMKVVTESKEEMLSSKMKYNSLVASEIDNIQHFWSRLTNYSNTKERISIEKSSYYDLINELSTKKGVEFRSLEERVLELQNMDVGFLVSKYKKLIKQTAELNNFYVDDLEVNTYRNHIHPLLMRKLDNLLVHLLKNSVDHAMETKEEREKKGKKIGRVTLTIKEYKSGFELSVEDDGKGIDTEKLLATALKVKALTKEKISKMNQEDKLRLIFLPGVSTSSSITKTSGRGIGSFSVLEDINSMGGSIKVESDLGKGSKFTLHLPSIKELMDKVEKEQEKEKI